MSAENSKPVREVIQAKSKRPSKYERIEFRNSTMSEQNFCSQVSKSFPCLHEENADEMCSKMHSACTSRRRNRNAPRELCSILKFAAHGFSASLVQIYLYDLIRWIKEIKETLKEIKIIYTGQRKDMPDIIADMPDVSPVIKKLVNDIADLNHLIQKCSEQTNSKEYFHLLRINQRIKNLWDKNLTWQEIEKKCDISNRTSWASNCSLVLAMRALQNVIFEYRNAIKTPLSDQERREIDSFIQIARQHFDDVLSELCRISSHLKDKHEEAYASKFSEGDFPTSDAKTIHPGFDTRVLDIAKGTFIWDLVTT